MASPPFVPITVTLVPPQRTEAPLDYAATADQWASDWVTYGAQANDAGESMNAIGTYAETQANAAAAQAVIATAQAVISTTQAGIATTQAGLALEYKDSAEAAAAAAQSAAGLPALTGNGGLFLGVNDAGTAVLFKAATPHFLLMSAGII